MLLVYLYDIAVPSRLAAPVQILSTARAAGERGADVIVGLGRLSCPPQQCLRFYGLDPHERLTLLPFFSRWAWHWRPARRLAQLIEGHPATGRGRVVLMSRGETGARLAPLIPDIRRRLQQRNVQLHFVYELHRLAHLHAAEGGASADEATRIRDAEGRAIATADGLVCINRLLLDAVRAEHTVACPALVLPSGTSDRIDLGPPLAQRDLDIFYAGKFDRRKGVGTLVSAMRHLPGRTLHLAGGTDSERKQLRALASAEGVADRVRVLDYIEPSAVGAFYHRAKVGACPLPAGASSIAERFTSPMKLLQMMACGTPVVSADVPSVREIVSHDQTAWLVPPNDPAALAEGLKLLLEDTSRADRLRHAAAQTVTQYTWPNRAKTLLEFCESL